MSRKEAEIAKPDAMAWRHSSWGLMHQRRMVLQMHYACQICVAPRMGASDRLIVWMKAEVFTLEVLFQVAVAVEGPRAYRCREIFLAEANNTLCEFAKLW